jgi:hypothetical protein
MVVIYQESSNVTLDQSSVDQTNLKPYVTNVYHMSSAVDLVLSKLMHIALVLSKVNAGSSSVVHCRCK